MAEDLHKDHLEDFFKDAFEEQSDLPPTDGWDVPSDQVWEKVEQVIHSTDGDDKGLIWWKHWGIGVLALILVLAGVFYFSYDKNKNIGEEVSPVEDRVLNQNSVQGSTDNFLVEQNGSEKISADRQNENLDSDIDPGSKGTSTQQKDKTASAHAANGTKASPENPSKTGKSLQNKNTSTAKTETLTPNELNQQTDIPFEKNNSQKNKPKKDSEATSPQNDLDLKSTPSNSKSIAQPKDIAATVENKESSSASNPIKDNNEKQSIASSKDSTIAKPAMVFEVLEPIPTKSLIAEVENTTADTLAFLPSPFTDLAQRPETAKSIKGFYVGISIAPTYTDRQIKITGNPVIPRDLKKNEMGQLSYSVGLNLGYKLSGNWSVESGFNYSTLTLERNARKQVRYSAVGERLNDRGEFEREYNFDIGTSSGEVNTDIALARAADSPVMENEFITLQLKAKQNIQYGSVPLIVRYQLGKGKLQAGLKAGLVNRFVLDGALRLEEVRIARSDFRLVLNDRVYRDRPLKNIKKYEADFLIGAGLSYQFNKKMWLTVEPTFTRSINPIFESQLFKTYPVITSLDVGFNYLF